MAITTTRRERVFLVAAIALGVVALVYNFGLKGALGALSERRDALRREKETYDAYIHDLRREPQVNRLYEELERRYPMTDQRAKEFTARIEKEFKSFGMTGVKINPPEEEVIEDAEDYGFVTLHIWCDGDIQKVAQMLDFFDQQAILVKDLKLRTYLDSPRINVEVSVSQIVKLSEEMKAQLEKKRAASSGSRSQPRRREPLGEL